jgi:hypothetical protein
MEVSLRRVTKSASVIVGQEALQARHVFVDEGMATFSTYVSSDGLVARWNCDYLPSLLDPGNAGPFGIVRSYTCMNAICASGFQPRSARSQSTRPAGPRV